MRLEVPALLIVDDEEHMCMLMTEIFTRRGCRVVCAHDGGTALDIFRNGSFAVTLLDIKIPGTNGLEVLARIREMDSRALVIMITAFNTVKTAVEAMRKGAYDYLTKPFDLEELEAVVDKAIATWRLVWENAYLRKKLQGLTDPGYFVGSSPAMRNLEGMVDRIAASEHSVLILGESGTGKSLLARVIHQQSPRRERPLVAVNCAAIPPTLLESELFGHEKGAFTGAIQRRVGKIERAHTGTLFLDEISTLSLPAQASLLQVLQEGQLERVGGSEPVKVNIRVIAASNQDLKSLVENGAFREDLYYRLNVLPIRIPPLRERHEDIIMLAHYLLERMEPGGRYMISAEAARILGRHEWPGNIRELENVLKQALVRMGDEEVLEPCHLPVELRRFRPEVPDGIKLDLSTGSLRDILSGVERQIIEETYRQTGREAAAAASALHIPLRTFYYRVNKLGIPL
jgi:DNA-binding NtrC family response regulator